MKKTLAISGFFVGLLIICYILFSTGQEHTFIIDNKYKNKENSQNIVLIIEGEKDKKIGKNKKYITDLKGRKHTFIIKIDTKTVRKEIVFPLNRGIEVSVEKLVEDKNDWYKVVSQY